MSRRVLFVSVLGALALGGCATIPQPLQGNYAPVSLESARSGTATAAPVRWGGQIIQTAPREQQTCFYVLAEPLDSQARPDRSGSEQGLGRFVACKQGFYDPEVFAKGREITVTGTLDGTVQHKIGEYDYTYPRVAANTIYLWPKRPVYVETPSPWGPWGPCDPFWSGWGCGGWGYGPWGWGYPPRVIVVPRSPPPPPKKG
ncbi:MAG TPA: Slp family lipoprotein [Rhodanobacteraceae bacterium]|nr:Slp family lipoprotein [Rhodanobacteraceae bacterium]